MNDFTALALFWAGFMLGSKNHLGALLGLLAAIITEVSTHVTR